MTKKHPKLKPTNTDERAKRHTHSVIAGLEDAISLLWAVIDEAARAILRMRSMVKKVMQILKITRAGPHAYDAKNLKKKDKL